MDVYMVDPYMFLKEKTSTCFDNHASAETHSSLPVGNESYQHRDEYDWGMHERYDKYTLSTVS